MPQANGAGDLVVARPEGLYCPPGDFYIDPWKPVARAVITHAHSDHARPGHAHYLAQTDSEGTLRARLGADITLQTLAYGEAITHHGVSCRCIRLVTCSVRRRCDSNTAAGRVGYGLRRATTRRSRRHLYAVRAGALRHLHYRFDLRPADLPLARAARIDRADRRLVARQCRSGPRLGAPLLRLPQGAAHSRERRCEHRPDRRAWRSRARSTRSIARPASRCRRPRA